MKARKEKLFFVNYEARRMLVLTASMSPPVELAHRRLVDWTWAHGHAPPNDPAILAAIAKCSPRAWLNVSACLLNHGWKAKPKRFWHPEAMRVLRQARVAYECAHRGGVLSGKRRRELREARSGSGPKLAPVPPQMPEPVPVSVQCPPQGLAFADLAEAAKPPGANAEEASNPLGRDLEGSSNPLRTGLRTPFELITINDKRLTINDSRLMNKDSLALNDERLTLNGERLPFSGLPHEEPSSEENRFLSTLAETLADFDPKQASQELTNWGGWWRLRFREDAAKARRVLAEVGSMIREKRIRTNAGAAAKDLWGRFA